MKVPGEKSHWQLGEGGGGAWLLGVLTVSARDIIGHVQRGSEASVTWPIPYS